MGGDFSLTPNSGISSFEVIMKEVGHACRFLLLEETRDDSTVATGVNYGVASSLSFELGLSL